MDEDTSIDRFAERTLAAFETRGATIAMTIPLGVAAVMIVGALIRMAVGA